MLKDRKEKTYPYFSFSSFIRGPLIREFIGARIPFSEMVPSRTCLAADWYIASVLISQNSNLQEISQCGLRTDSARNADQLGHCRITTGPGGSTVFAEGRSSGFSASILVLDFELVLKHLKRGLEITEDRLKVKTVHTTRSRSPSSNCIFSSRVAHRVSKGLPLGVILASEKIPTASSC